MEIYLCSDFLERLRAFVGLLGLPVLLSQINNIHKHEPQSAGQLWGIDHRLDACEVHIHHRLALFGTIQVSTNGLEKLGQRLNLGFIRDASVIDQLLNTLMHDTFC